MGPKPKDPVPQPVPQPVPDVVDPIIGDHPGPGVEEKIQPPPTTLYRPSESVAPLVDIPCVYLLDRSSWPEFQRALNECGLTWNLSEWMTTIVHHGVEWKQVVAGGTPLQDYFPQVEKKSAGDGSYSKTSLLGQKLVATLKLPKNLGDLRPSTQFCCLSTVEFEDDRRLPARQRMWSWMVRSLRGNRQSAGPYHYLVDEVQMYDISHLFKRLLNVLEQITICSLDC